QPAYIFGAGGLLFYFEAQRATCANQAFDRMRRRELLEKEISVEGNAVQRADASQRPDKIVSWQRLNQSSLRSRKLLCGHFPPPLPRQISASPRENINRVRTKTLSGKRS